MIIKIVISFFFIGLATGIISRYAKVSRALLSLTCGVFLLPFLGVEQASFYPFLLASVLVASLPINLYLWLHELKRGADQTLVFKYAPSIAMGAVIGAQLVSILSALVLQAILSIFVALLLLIGLYKTISQLVLNKTSIVNSDSDVVKAKPVFGILFGAGSVLAADDNYLLSKLYLNQTSHFKLSDQYGLGVFICFAALVGFVFPALQPTLLGSELNEVWLAGLVYLPITLSLAAGLLLSVWLPNWRISEFESNFISFCVNLYLFIYLIRIWF